MEGRKLAGIAFRQRRVARGLSTTQVAELLRIERRYVVAFEQGILLQQHEKEQKRICSLNMRWTLEDSGYDVRRVV